MPSRPLCFGHRGARAYAPENTLLSFTTAIEMGVDGIELDIYGSKDGALIVTHDDAMEVNGTRYRISKLDLAEIQAIELPQGQHVPTLEEVLQATAGTMGDGRLLYSIDLKDLRVADAYHDVLVKQKVMDRVYTCLESRLFIKKVQRSHPDFTFVYSTHVNPDGVIEDLDKLDPGSIAVVNLPAGEVTPEVVASIKEKGFRAFVWDVNDAGTMHVHARHADGLYSDFPDLLVQAVASI